MSRVNRSRSADSGEQFAELEAARKQKPPRAEEFIALVDLWQRTPPPTGGGGADAVGYEAVDPVEQARREAEKIVETAKAEAARLQEEAQRRGRAEGERQGRAEAEKEYAQRLGGLGKILKNLEGQRGAIIRRYREELLLLATTMTDRLVHHEISVNPAVIESCFRGAMEYVIENSLVKVHLNPDDFHHLKEAGLTDPALFGGKNRVQLVEDPAVAAGGCLLKSSFGEIDATLESCRDKLYQAVDLAFQAALAQEGAAAEKPLELDAAADEGEGSGPVGD
ncbi:FliH/SctL family protein [Desulfurivibrio sp. D14AmB]|uniref:FliH/SctL family protein n=1 Tax=Desulfurivibrio sp. D14AmB TaxID=3374370 RepID=UPI00376F44DA